jgi:bacterial/archaeal transporter family protein
MPSQSMLIVMSIIGWGIGSLFYKVANDNIHPIMVTTIVTAVYILVTPFAFIFFKFDTHINGTGLLFAVLGGLSMAVGSLGYFYALRNGAGGTVTALTALYPALTLLLSALFMKETISLKQGIGMVLALVSFFLINLK